MHEVPLEVRALPPQGVRYPKTTAEFIAPFHKMISAE